MHRLEYNDSHIVVSPIETAVIWRFVTIPVVRVRYEHIETVLQIGGRVVPYVKRLRGFPTLGPSWLMPHCIYPRRPISGPEVRIGHSVPKTVSRRHRGRGLNQRSRAPGAILSNRLKPKH